MAKTKRIKSLTQLQTLQSMYVCMHIHKERLNKPYFWTVTLNIDKAWKAHALRTKCYYFRVLPTPQSTQNYSPRPFLVSFLFHSFLVPYRLPNFNSFGTLSHI